MSNNVIIPEYPIIAPSLNDTNYASTLSSVFNNINNNFTLLANKDFVKGDQGNSVEIIKYNIYDTESEQYTDIGDKIVNTIRNHPKYLTTSETIYFENDSVNLFDNLINNPGSLYMICNINSEDGVNFNKVPVSSLYYVFLDGRFANNELNMIDESLFTNIEDLSCVLIYNSEKNDGAGGFDILNNAFPTIYYESGVGLCWKLNGNATGIPVKGPQGKAGEDAKLYIVKCKDNTSDISSTYFELEVTHIFESNKYIDINTYINNNNEFKDNREYAAVIYGKADPKNQNSGFYFGVVKKENDKIIAVGSTLSIDNIVQQESIVNFLKNINIKSTDTSVAKGLFIPMEESKADSTQKVHLLSATSITNFEGDSNLNTDIIWTPINNINKLDLTDNNLQVDKYLYLKIDIDTLCKEIRNNYQENDYISGNYNLVDIIKNALESRNGILKYKLTNNIKTIPDQNNSISGKSVFNFTNNSNVEINNNILNISDAKCLLNTTLNIDNSTLQIGPKLTPDNTCYLYNTIALSSDNNGAIKLDDLQYSELLYKHINSDKPESVKYIKADNTAINGVVIETEDLSINNINKVSKYIPSKDDSDRYSTIPLEFGNILFNPDQSQDKKGIYRWILDFGYNNFDVEELNIKADKSKNIPEYKNTITYNGKNINISSIYALFNTIFTTTLNPTALDSILWFNGINKNYYEDSGSNESKTEYDNKIVLKGWEFNPNIFNFLKFVPSYNNDFSISDDTSLNINYNLNVTGDINNPNKNITVHGNVITDNLQVHETAVINKIEDIYTERDIIGNSGLNIGKTDNDFNFKVSSTGLVDLNRLNVKNNITINSQINSSKKNTQLKYSNDNFEIFSTSNKNKINLWSDEESVLDLYSTKNTELTVEGDLHTNVTIGNSESDTNLHILDKNFKINTTETKIDGIEEVVKELNLDFNNNPNIRVGNGIDNIIKISPNEYSCITSNENTIKDKIEKIIETNDNPLKIETCTTYSPDQKTNRLGLSKPITNNTNKYTNNTGSGYGPKGNAYGPYSSIRNGNEGNEYKSDDEYEKYTMFPYTDIPGSGCKLFWTPLYKEDYYVDRPFRTNICNINIPFVEVVNEENNEENNYNRLLQGISIDNDNTYNFNKYDNSEIKLKLSDKNFTFFAGVGGKYSNNIYCEIPVLQHNPGDIKSNYYKSYVEQKVEFYIDIYSKLGNELKMSIPIWHDKVYDDTYIAAIDNKLLHNDKYKLTYTFGEMVFPNIDEPFVNGFDFAGNKTNLYDSNGRFMYIINQYNVKLNDIIINTKILFENINTLKNSTSYGEYFKSNNYELKLNINTYTESTVSFKTTPRFPKISNGPVTAGLASYYSLMSECHLTPLIYAPEKQYNNEKDNKNNGPGIYLQEEWGTLEGKKLSMDITETTKRDGNEYWDNFEYISHNNSFSVEITKNTYTDNINYSNSDYTDLNNQALIFNSKAKHGLLVAGIYKDINDDNTVAPFKLFTSKNNSTKIDIIDLSIHELITTIKNYNESNPTMLTMGV